MTSHLSSSVLSNTIETRSIMDFMETKTVSIEDLIANVSPAYQPIIEVASGRIHSYEALARSKDATGALVSAGKLFTENLLSHNTKLQLDRAVRKKALAQMENLPAGASLTINVSPQWISSLGQSDTVPTIAMIDDLAIDPSRLIIELTEFKGDVQRIKEIVHHYRELGIRIAIDDFGAGFSQIDRLIALEPDIIKLDMKLFKQANQGGLAQSVVESLAQLALKNGAVIVCEGVETEEEFNFGLKCGARYMQGFLFATAQEDFLPVNHFETMVSTLRQRFFEERRQFEAEKIAHINKIKQLIGHIKTQILDIPASQLPNIKEYIGQTEPLIRYFICDPNGKQLTPNHNYNHSNQDWDIDPLSHGENWAWRPYFYQLAAIIPQDPERLVASHKYQDIRSGEACKTIATQLDPHRILLVDVFAYWD